MAKQTKISKKFLALILAFVMLLSLMPATVAFAAPPTLTGPVNATVTAGSAATFTVTANDGVAPYQYQWQSNAGGTWENISGATAAAFTTGNATASMAGASYRCVVTDANSESVTSSAAMLTVAYDVASTISPIGILNTEAALNFTSTRSYVINVATAADYMLVLNSRAWRHLDTSSITITIDGVSTVVTDATGLPYEVLGNYMKPVSFTAGAHTVSIVTNLASSGGHGELEVASLSFAPYSKVLEPTFSQPADYYDNSLQLSLGLNEVWSGASIRYTLDGTDPSATVGTQYTGAFSVFPAGAAAGTEVTVKAIAYMAGKTASSVVSAHYIVGATPTLNTPTSNRADNATLTNSTMPATLSVSGAPTGTIIYYTLDGTTPTANSERYWGPVLIPSACALKAMAINPANGARSAVATYNYRVQASAPTAVVYPSSGTTVRKGSTIGLTTATSASPDIKIWYTTDGSQPTTSSTLYTGTIAVPTLADGATFTVKAIAGGDGILTSTTTLTATYTFSTSKALTEIKADPDFIAWRAGNFEGNPPQSLITLINELYEIIPKDANNMFRLFAGGGSASTRIPGTAWTPSGLANYGIPSAGHVDGPAGMRITASSGAAYSRDATYWPNSTARSATWNMTLEEAVGTGWGNEMVWFGVDTLLAPGLNIHRSVLGGRNFEYYSEDPLLAGLAGAAEVNGVQSNGTGVAVKHFAMNNQETTRTNGNSQANTRTVREIYLRAFQYLQENSKPWTYMTSFNAINNVAASQSYDLNTTILRNEWGFDGLVMTDYNGYGSTSLLYPYNDGLGNAPNTHAGVVKAGVEMLLASATPANIMAGYTNGYLTDAVVRQAFMRFCIYTTKLPAFNGNDFSYYTNQEMWEENDAVALQVAQEGAVLLKNDNNALPLQKEAAPILSLGMAASRLYRGGTGSGSINMTTIGGNRIPGLPEALREVGNIEVLDTSAMGFSRTASIIASGAMSSTGARDEIVVPAAQWAAWENTDMSAIFFVLQRESGENADVATSKGAYYISDAEENLINGARALADKKNIPFIIVMNTGTWISAYSVTANPAWNAMSTWKENWMDKADAIMQCWNTGQQGGKPMAQLIFGDANPSGKLPTTVPLDTNHRDANGNLLTPSFGQAGRSVSNPIYKEGIFVGYRYHEKFDVEYAYAFGHGLSYTTFDYLNPTLSKKTFSNANDKLTASVTIKNTGDVAGKEVGQFYIGAPGLDMIKPVKELKGFMKTEQLDPGASQTITAEFNAMSLASYKESTGEWVVEPGHYVVYFAAASDDVKAVKTFTVTSEIIADTVTKDAMKPASPVAEYTVGQTVVTFNIPGAEEFKKAYTVGAAYDYLPEPEDSKYIYEWYTEAGLVNRVYPETLATAGDKTFYAKLKESPFKISVATGDTFVMPITVKYTDDLSGLRGIIEYDESLLDLQSITAAKGFSVVSDVEAGSFVMVTPAGAAVSGSVTIGYAIFKAKADLNDDVSTVVSFPSENISAFDHNGNLIETITLHSVDVLIEGIPPMIGDVNLSGEVDVADAIFLMQYLAGSRELSARQLKAADVNRDGKVNVGDVTIIMQMCL